MANAPDPVYQIKQGGWYGWPDFAAGEPLTDPKFKSQTKNAPLANLLQEHPAVEKPIALFEPGTGLMKFGFAPNLRQVRARTLLLLGGRYPCALAGAKGLQHDFLARR